MIPRKQWARKACAHVYNIPNSFRVELNLYLNEARRKAHNKPINTLSHLIHAGKRLRNL